MRLRLAFPLRLPATCCCCGRSAAGATDLFTIEKETTIPLLVANYTTTSALQVPTCSGCRGHMQWGLDGGWSDVVAEVVGGLLGYVVFGAIGVFLVNMFAGRAQPSGEVHFALAVVLGVALTAALRGPKLWRELPRGLGPEHACRGLAVSMVAVDDRCVTLDVAGPAFAAQLQSINQVV